MPHVKKARLRFLEAREQQYNDLIVQFRTMTPEQLKAWQLDNQLRDMTNSWIDELSADFWQGPPTRSILDLMNNGR